MAYYQRKNHPYSSKKIRMPFVMLLTILFFGIGCSDSKNQPFINIKSSTPKPTTAVNQQSATIKVAVIPTQSSPEQFTNIQELSEYLEKSLFRKFDIQIQKDYETAVELLVSEKVQIAYLGSLTYIKAKQNNPNIQPILAPITKTTGRPWHTSVIIANANKIKSIQDLKNKRFGFVSKSSTTGFLIPQVEFFQAQNINPAQTLTEIKFLGSDHQAIAALTDGEVDAVAVAQEAFIKAQSEKKIDPKKYIKIWESSPLPTDPIVVSTKLDPRLINGIKKALLDAPPGIIALSGTENAGYTIVDDINYERIRRLLQQLQEN
ncbi:MAG: phosphate/phosphite/phosphonate ABC transporter substrate-binding protein [Nostocales cyanobacterium]|nr:MAG: phosphate/phosphite/phosphonate ABC transporter substrate-binding protein [Nostocales cyanobacterium]TAF13939.1 MAG: phosphate/phosphite/phosphonate ABC transporter substrate-binding protein [Nostocales cyanobacterium]